MNANTQKSGFQSGGGYNFTRTLGLQAAAAVGVLLCAPFASAAWSNDRPLCPKHMALVGKTCVDKFEGSLVERTADGREVPFSPYQAPNGHDVRAVSRPGVVPQAHISMIEARRACKASGKRLCKASEWKSACKGPEKTRYPYGNERKPNACVDTRRTSPIMTLHHGVFSDKTLNDPRLNQMPNTVAMTGASPTCTSGYGVQDMVGNVHEWAEDGAFHGGYYLDTRLNNEGCDYKTTAHAREYYDYSTGFRCCADAGSLPTDDSDEEVPTIVKRPEEPKPHASLKGAEGTGSQGVIEDVSEGAALRNSWYPIG